MPTFAILQRVRDVASLKAQERKDDRVEGQNTASLVNLTIDNTFEIAEQPIPLLLVLALRSVGRATRTRRPSRLSPLIVQLSQANGRNRSIHQDRPCSGRLSNRRRCINVGTGDARVDRLPERPISGSLARSTADTL